VNRPAGLPRSLPPATAEPLPEAISGESCDRCGAAARRRVPVAYLTAHGTRRPGALLFCSHCYDGALPALAAAGLRVT
jgi:hypothetical protein